MTDTLRQILSSKKEHITRKRRERPENALLADAKHANAPRGFTRTLRAKADNGEFALIAEIKKASPSKGVIREDFSPPHLAESYAKGGASCLSVLTDAPYFQGRDEYIAEARAACALPVLRKDFMIEPYQIVESRALGADCILLIMAALSNGQAQELYAAAEAMQLDVLVEVHNEAELERACTALKPQMIGVNNRDLKTFTLDLAVSERLARHMPDGILRVSESGIYAHDDLKRLSSQGFFTFLVGESLMREQDVEKATKELLMPLR